MMLMHRIRLRVLAVLVGLALAGIGAVSFAAVPIWTVVGVAVAAAAVAVNTMASRIGQETCLACGADLSNEPIGAYGVICPECGSLTEPRDPRLAKRHGAGHTPTATPSELDDGAA